MNPEKKLTLAEITKQVKEAKNPVMNAMFSQSLLNFSDQELKANLPLLVQESSVGVRFAHAFMSNHQGEMSEEVLESVLNVCTAIKQSNPDDAKYVNTIDCCMDLVSTELRDLKDIDALRESTITELYADRETLMEADQGIIIRKLAGFFYEPITDGIANKYIAFVNNLRKEPTIFKSIKPIDLIAKTTVLIVASTGATALQLTVGTAAFLALSVSYLIQLGITAKQVKWHQRKVQAQITKVDKAIKTTPDAEKKEALGKYKASLISFNAKLEQYAKAKQGSIKENFADLEPIVGANENDIVQVVAAPIVEIDSTFFTDDTTFGEYNIDNLQLEFAVNFVDAFMREGDEVNLEAFNRLESIAHRYETALEANAITKGARKVALGAEKGARNVTDFVRGKSAESRKVKVVAKRIPQHMDSLVNSTLDRMKKMDRDERRRRIVDGSMRLKLFKILRNGIVFGTALYVAPALAALGFLVYVANDKILDMRVRQKLVDELEDELKLVNEKIRDADSNRDTKQKYQLMRIKNRLENDIRRIQHNLPTA